MNKVNISLSRRIALRAWLMDHNVTLSDLAKHFSLSKPRMTEIMRGMSGPVRVVDGLRGLGVPDELLPEAVDNAPGLALSTGTETGGRAA